MQWTTNRIHRRPAVSTCCSVVWKSRQAASESTITHEQVNKMLARGMNPDHFESYLMIHKYGIPPHGGLGLGLERFTSRLLEQNNIRYATLFPRDIHRVTPLISQRQQT